MTLEELFAAMKYAAVRNHEVFAAGEPIRRDMIKRTSKARSRKRLKRAATTPFNDTHYSCAQSTPQSD